MLGKREGQEMSETLCLPSFIPAYAAAAAAAEARKGRLYPAPSIWDSLSGEKWKPEELVPCKIIYIPIPVYHVYLPSYKLHERWYIFATIIFRMQANTWY